MKWQIVKPGILKQNGSGYGGLCQIRMGGCYRLTGRQYNSNKYNRDDCF